MGYVESLLAENELIVMRTRQHWIVLARSFAVNAFWLVVVSILALLAAMQLGPVGLLAAILYILPVAAFSRDYLQWWNEEYIVTNRRVVQAEGIINKHVVDSSLEMVNDVVLNQSFLGRLLDYGNVEILTASEMGVNNLHRIVSPVKFKTEMLNQREHLGTGGHRGGSVDVPSLIAELDQLRKQGALSEDEFNQKKAQLLSKL